MQYKKAHFIGIAGKGMSATALLLKQMGVEITGSDAGFYPPVSTYLQNAGIHFAEGYKKENIPADADVIIIGKNAKLVPEENEEVKAALDSGLPVKSFPDILEELTSGKETIVVVGSYGKSTCTALLSWCLKESGCDPSYFIGEVTKGFDAYAHLGQGPVFVLEGDEYPSSNWDPTSKFLHYRAKNVLLTSATHDHFNVYPTHASYLEPFRNLLASLPQDGLLVASREKYAQELASAYAGKKVWYSQSDENPPAGGWHAKGVSYGKHTTFILMQGEREVIQISTSLLGVHNIENIVGVAAMLLEKELLTPQELAKAVATFEGVKRRLESLAQDSRVPVLEGFGSSYEKAKSAMDAMKLHFPSRRIVVIFEPHTFSWRNKSALPWCDTVFDGAGAVYIYEPASQGAATHAQATQEEIVARVRDSGINARAITSEKEMLDLLHYELKEGDAVLLLTSGDLGGLIGSVPKLAEELYPKEI